MEYNINEVGLGIGGLGIGGCYFLFSFLHHHQTVSYDILREISKRGEFKCGWANAVAGSKKAGSFMPLSEIEKVPAPRQLPKRPRPTETSWNFTEELMKKRLDYFTTDDNEGMLLIDCFLIMITFLYFLIN